MFSFPLNFVNRVMDTYFVLRNYYKQSVFLLHTRYIVITLREDRR